MSQSDSDFIEQEASDEFWRHAAVADIMKMFRVQSAALCTLLQSPQEMEAIAKYLEDFAAHLRTQAEKLKSI